jgi:hypothetical protein
MDRNSFRNDKLCISACEIFGNLVKQPPRPSRLAFGRQDSK